MKKTHWYQLDLFQPENDLPCEYKMEVVCKGWYRPTETEFRFAPDDRAAPEVSITHWRYWKDGEKWPEAKKLIREFREMKKKESS